MKSTCTICKGEGWVCEDHAYKAWGEGDGCCAAAGMPCICHPWFKELTIIDCLKKMSSSKTPPEFDKTFRENFDKLLA